MDNKYKVDRRILKTKNAIRKAFLDLIEEGKNAEFTVSSICRKANINRNTFYYHYMDVDELANEIAASFLEEMEQIYAADVTVAQRNTAVCKVFQENRAIVTMLNCTGFRTNISRRLETLSFSYMKNALKKTTSNYTDEEFEVAAHYLVYGAQAAIFQWVQSESNYTPEQMGELLTRLMEKGI